MHLSETVQTLNRFPVRAMNDSTEGDGAPPPTDDAGTVPGALPDPVRAALLETERDAVVGRLLRGIAHDLNNPISSVSGFAELLEEAEEMGEQERKWAGIVRESADRAAEIARSLLSFGRQGRRADRVEDAVEVLEGTLRLARLDLGRRGVSAELEWERVVPPLDIGPSGLQHIALNLLFNAADAVEADDGGAVVLALDVGDGIAVVECRDEGPGVPDGIADRIFEPLFTTREDRVGIGLTTARWLAEEVGGSLVLVEDGGPGATFRVTIPIREAAGEEGDRALVVERASELRMLAKLHLAGMGYDVDEASSPAEAGARVRQGSYALILADVSDPSEGARLLAALGDDAVERLVVTTGALDTPAGREWLDELGRPVLRKPYGEAELVSCLEEAGLDA